MTDSTDPNQQREFHCEYCNGRIQIPYDLPPSTGPCPHCEETITSPPPPEPQDLSASPFAMLAPEAFPKPAPATISEPASELFDGVEGIMDIGSAPAPKAVPVPAPVPVSAPKRASAPKSEFFDGVEGIIGLDRLPPRGSRPVPVPVTKPAPKPAPVPAPVGARKDEPEAPKTQPATAAPKKASKGVAPLLIALLFLILSCGGAVFYLLSKKKDESVALPQPVATPKPPAANEADYIRTGWKADALKTLTAFMEGAGVEQKLPHIRDAESLREKMEGFYTDPDVTDSDIPAKSFSVLRELPEDIRKRGIFMLSFEPPAGAAAKQARVHAFFKRTEEGLKLDWEVFAQTKYRTLRHFAQTPQFGAKETFRVLIDEDTPAQGAGGMASRTYRLRDPANIDDSVRVSVNADSANGKELAAINWRGTTRTTPILRTATVELEWTGQADKPVLSMSRFICWEFLGLGGTEIPATAAPR